MQLDYGDHSIKNATAADLARALPSGGAPEDWWIALEKDNGDCFEADAVDGDSYAVSYVDDGKLFTLEPRVDGAELRTLLNLYLSGDESWRRRHPWTPYAPPARSGLAALSNGPRAPLLAAAAFGLFFLATSFGLSPLQYIPTPRWPFPPPFDSTPARIIILFFGAVGLLILVAATVKYVEVRRAARWPSAHGRITQSESGFDTPGDQDGALEGNLAARIAYTFSVDGKIYTGRRVTMAETIAPEDVPLLLEKYPAGRIVDVFYDPRDPQKSVLERGVPAGASSSMITLFGLLAFFAGVALMFAFAGLDLIYAVLPNAKPIVFLPAALVAFVLLRIFWSFWAKHHAAQNWPTVVGEVLVSNVTTVRAGEGRAHAPIVEYRYRVAGKDYKSRQIRAGSSTAGSDAAARKTIAPYPKGAAVKVRYNPANPFDAALETRMGLIWLLALFGGVAALIALLSSGLI